MLVQSQNDRPTASACVTLSLEHLRSLIVHPKNLQNAFVRFHDVVAIIKQTWNKFGNFKNTKFSIQTI
jgi:hypothetical protein